MCKKNLDKLHHVLYNAGMATKTRELVAEPIRSGFWYTGYGKGSHRKYRHASGVCVNIPGHDGDEAKPYLVKQVQRAISEASKKAGGV